MTDRDYFKAHEAGLELMGRGTGVPDSLKTLADCIESIESELACDKTLAALGATIARLIIGRLSNAPEHGNNARPRSAPSGWTRLNGHLWRSRA